MVTDLLIRIQNAQMVKKDFVKAPFSNIDFAIAEILTKNGFLATAAKKGRMPKRSIEMKLKYNKDGSPAITGMKFLSKPSRRMYSGSAQLKKVKQGYGMGVLSTSKGILTYKDAKKSKVGGQLLFEIW